MDKLTAARAVAARAHAYLNCVRSCRDFHAHACPTAGTCRYADSAHRAVVEAYQRRHPGLKPNPDSGAADLAELHRRGAAAVARSRYEYDVEHGYADPDTDA